jgi:4-amino-4-deoxy-L-arabinose transferase-like glycosyltransferase
MQIQDQRWAKLLLASAFIIYLFSLANQIQEVDPAQYAEISREMVESKDWLTLHDNYGPYLDKPPMTMWMIAACFKAFGVSDFSCRLPTIICAMLSVFLIGRIAQILYDRSRAILAMLILASSEAVVIMVADPKIDMVLTFLLCAAFWAYFESRTRPEFIRLFYLFTGLGVMTKGPIAICIPALAIGCEWLFLRDPKKLWRMKPVSGLIILALTIIPWHLVLYEEQGIKATYFMLFAQSFGRLVIRDFKNSTTPFYFMHTFFWAFLPWSLACLFAAASGITQWWKSKDRFQYNPRRVLVWWFALPFMFISASSYKLPQYLFWLLPPLAILLSDFFIALPRNLSPKLTRALTNTQVAVGAGCLLAAVIMPAVAFPLQKSWLWGLLLAGVMGISIIPWYKSTFLQKAVLWPASAALFMNLVFVIHVYPEAVKFQYSQAAAHVLNQEDPAGRVAYTYKLKTKKAYAFHAQRQVLPVSIQFITDAVNQKGKVLVLTKQAGLDDLRALEGKDNIKVETLAEFADFHTSIPTLKFILAKTRPRAVDKVMLLRVSR